MALPLLADAPDLTQFAIPEAPNADDAPSPPTSRIQLFKTGKFRHPRWGKFNITQQVYDSFIANFNAGIPWDRLPGDFDHAPSITGSTRANGWIVELERVGEELWATVQWTWTAVSAIREGEYRYISPEFSMAYVSDDETRRGPTLLGFALTNRAFLERMAAVTLAQGRSDDELAELAFASQEIEEPAEDDAPESSDSPAPMAELTKIASALGLDENADEQAVVTAAQELSARAEQVPGEDQVVLSKSDFETLKTSKANEATLLSRVETLESEARDARFEAAFTSALEHKDGPKVTPAEREELRELFDLNEAAFNKTLSLRQPIANTKAQGARGDETDAPEGVDEDAYRLHQEVQAFMAEHDESDYTVALGKVLESRVAA